MKVKEYQIAWGIASSFFNFKNPMYAHEVLENNVNILLKQGFQPLGGIVSDASYELLYQVMVKYEA